MRMIIAGGRDFTDVEYAVPRFQRVHLVTPVTTLICGMARGGDAIGLAWAKELGIPVEEYHADWKTHGKAAGPIRNLRMRDEGKPDMVLGLPGGTGTANMLSIARESGIKVIEYRYNYSSRATDPVGGFMSNFYPHEQVDEDGIVYPTNEHWYQCEKTLDPATRDWILASPKPGEAKRRGNTKSRVVLRDDWETYKFEAMMKGLRMKFSERSSLTDRLLHTGDDYLVEYTTWNDRIWGVGQDYKGLNWLGRLLMRRRDELMSGKLYA